MRSLAVLTPAVLLLLMLLLGRLERWLDAATPPESPSARHRRWRRTSRPVRAAATVEPRAGRRLLARRAVGRPRRRAVAAVRSASLTTTSAGRRPLRSRRR